MAKAKRGVAPRRGKSERRTAPARGTKARGAATSGLRRAIAATRSKRKPTYRRKKAPTFAPSEKVFHLVNPERDPQTGADRASALTACCAQPIDKVYAVALTRDHDTQGLPWCPKLVPA